MKGTQNVIASLVGKMVRQRDGQDGEKRDGQKEILFRVFVDGREPTEEEVQQWMQTLKEAAEDGGLAL